MILYLFLPATFAPVKQTRKLCVLVQSNCLIKNREATKISISEEICAAILYKLFQVDSNLKAAHFLYQHGKIVCNNFCNSHVEPYVRPQLIKVKNDKTCVCCGCDSHLNPICSHSVAYL